MPQGDFNMENMIKGLLDSGYTGYFSLEPVSHPGAIHNIGASLMNLPRRIYKKG
jgi:hypothetical protein